jgi:hypothetical protein
MLYVILSVILMSVDIPCVIMLSVIILSVIICHRRERYFYLGGAGTFNKMKFIKMTFSVA